jgi:hypothetical protein
MTAARQLKYWTCQADMMSKDSENDNLHVNFGQLITGEAQRR